MKKVASVGAGSKGIGRAISQELSPNCFKVVEGPEIILSNQNAAND